MTDDTSAAVEAGDGSEDVRDELETVEAQESDSPKGQEADTPEGDESEDDSPKELSEDERRRRDKNYKKHLRKETAEAKRESAEAKREVAELKARQEKIKASADSDAAPKEADFEEYDDWKIAKALWEHEQRRVQREIEAVGSEVEEAQRKLEQIDATEKRLVQENFAAQVADARTRYADYDDVVFKNTDVHISKDVADIVTQSDMGADVAYYLASNKALAAEISAMTPIEAARAIGRIEAKIAAPRPRSTSTAPDPITPVKGKAAATKDPSKMSMAEYKKWRASQG